MALLFCDGFDHWNDDTDVNGTKWDYIWGGAFTVGTFDDGTARNGRCLDFRSTYSYSGDAYKLVAARSTLIAGAAFFQSHSGGNGLFGFYDGTTAQICLERSTAGYLQVRRGPTGQSNVLLAEGPTYSAFAWHYIEFRATISNTTGSYEVRLDGQTVMQGSGLDTQATSNATANRVKLGGGAVTTTFSGWVDDLYMCNTDGAYNNDFLGDIKIETIYPTSAGAHTDWAANTGTNYETVDEPYDPDGDTTYVYSGTTDNVDTYTYGDLVTTTGSVKGVQWIGMLRKDDAGTRLVAPVYRHDGVDYVGAEISIPTSYAYKLEITEENPGTELAWTIDDVNSAEFGIKVTG